MQGHKWQTGLATVCLLGAGLGGVGCGGSAPATCESDTCNASHGGGTCSTASGKLVCTCSAGYIGADCRQCAAGYHPADGACARDEHTVCAMAAGGAGGPVQAPVLRATLPGSWDENWFASPAVADLDNDGRNEIIAARHSVLYVWNDDGTLKWKTAWANSASTSPEHGSSRMWASPVVGNFDADPYLEIAVGSDADSTDKVNLAVYDHKGELLPGWPKRFGSGAFEVRSIAGGDLDGDGTMEIVVSKTGEMDDGPLTAVYRLDGTMRPGWPQIDHATCDPPAPAEPCWEAGGYNQNVGVADVDSDGFLDVISTYDAIGFGVFDRDGKPFPANAAFESDRVITSCEAYSDFSLAKQGWGNGDRSEFTTSPPVIADVNQDGRMDYVLVGDHESTTSTANQGATFWVLNLDMTRPPGWEVPKDSDPPLSYGGLDDNIVKTPLAPAVGNIDADPALEIVAPSYDGYVYAFDGQSGARQWRYQFAKVASPYTGASEALIADLNGDGVPEILFNTYSSGKPGTPDTPAHLIILNNNGVELFKIEIAKRGSMAAPTLADVDGDGSLELILSLKDALGGGQGGVQIWDVPNSAANCLVWPTGRGNYLRQGWAKP